jgi:hypothetical protein
VSGDLLFGRRPGKVSAVGRVTFAAEVAFRTVGMLAQGERVRRRAAYCAKPGSGSYAGAALKTPMPLEVR